MAAEASKIGSRDKSVGWYVPTLESILSKQRDLLENYSRIPSDQVIPTILRLRDLAWEVYPYPCVGQFRFIDLSLCELPSYSSIVDSIQKGEIFVDIGCCFGQDIRKLVHDGAPAKNLWGVELAPEFVDLGYQLFNDEDTLESRILKADLYDPKVDELTGKAGIIYLGLFLHLWDWEGQKKACERIVQLLQDKKGVLVIGQQIGSVTSHEFTGRMKMFKHDAQSFGKLWAQVGESTGTKWEVSAALDYGLGAENFAKQWNDETTRRLTFEVRRIA